MGWLLNAVIIIVVLWLLYGAYDMYKNKDRSMALMKMALNTGRKEGAEIRSKIDTTIKPKK